jgi:elongation factor Ts
MSISASDVKTLREITGAGMMDCKKALAETDGDMEKAKTWLREKGIASATKRSGRTAADGAVCSYIHLGGKIGVLCEINCETDFVAKGEKFQELCKDICLQICSAAPRWVRREEVPADIIEQEKEIYKKQLAESGKPANMLDKIAEGKLGKFYEENCLLEQIYIKDNKTKIEAMIKELSGQVGEKIEVRRFVRYQLGEGIEVTKADFAEEVMQAVKDAKSN